MAVQGERPPAETAPRGRRRPPRPTKTPGHGLVVGGPAPGVVGVPTAGETGPGAPVVPRGQRRVDAPSARLGDAPPVRGRTLRRPLPTVSHHVAAETVQVETAGQTPRPTRPVRIDVGPVREGRPVTVVVDVETRAVAVEVVTRAPLLHTVRGGPRVSLVTVTPRAGLPLGLGIRQAPVALVSVSVTISVKLLTVSTLAEEFNDWEGGATDRGT